MDFTVRSNKTLSQMFLAAVFLMVLAAVCYAVTRPYLFVETDKDILLSLYAKTDQQVTLRYVHSVQKTPVVENFEIRQDNKLVLVSTEYRSFGVGLPFLVEEGNFRIAGDRFILEGLQRSFDKVSLRTGPEAQLSMDYDGKKYPLYQYVPSGSLVYLRVGPYYTRWL